MRALSRYNKDYYGGALMVLLGLSAVFGSMQYHIGTLEHMGSGFFPTAVGVLLVVVGLAIALSASRPTIYDKGEPFRPDCRGWSCIVGGTMAFAVLGVYGGLIPASFAIVFLSALGDRATSVKEALLLAIAMVAVSVIVFHWALQLAFPLFSWG